MSSEPLGLFAGFGIEIEYMIVGGPTLAVRPVADQLLMREHGSHAAVVRGPIGWCNELVLHVIELKTDQPAPSLAPVASQFAAEVRRVNQLLLGLGSRLLPTGMHPTMDPHAETRLWPHDGAEIYAAFDQVFGCQGHGWSNLQSTHLNLPFAGDEEFGRLHAAVRLLLPLLPALTASSPVVEGRLGDSINGRLGHYRSNCIRVPSVTGNIVPEPAFTRKDYEMRILARVYQDLAELEPAGVLQHEWSNARGAIARFSRSSLEIRLLDTQECPAVDLAHVALIVQVLRQLVGEQSVAAAEQRGWAQAPLVKIMRETIAYADQATIADPAYLRALGYEAGDRASAGDLWRHLIERAWPDGDPDAGAFRQALAPWVARGPLGRRIVQALGKKVSRDGIVAVYGELADCLADGKPFR